MKRVAITMLMCGVGLTLSLAWAAEKPASTQPKAILMRAKMASAQKVMEGLVEKNFALIKKGSEELVQIGEAGKWQPNDDHVYNHFSVEFRRQAQKLVTLGEDQNLEGATYVYLGLITTCVECHTHCRDVLRIASEPVNLQAAPPSSAESVRD